MNYDYSKSGFGLSRRKKYMGYSKINEEIRYRPTSTLVRTIETIEAFDLTQAQVEFFFVSIQLEIRKPSDSQASWIRVAPLNR